MFRAWSLASSEPRSLKPFDCFDSSAARSLSDEPLVADCLVAWLYGTAVARLTRRDNHGIGVEWEQAALDRWSLGSRVLSVALPVGDPIGPRDSRGLDFFENLLPEGPAIETMARIAGVSRYDTFGILAAFGEDCAGAIVILPEGRSVDASEKTTYLPMTSDDLAEAIRSLDKAPLGVDLASGYKPSLPGFQRKLLLGRSPEGDWLRPTHGAPSSWILKPDGRTPMADNEATCLGLAAACGLPVPDVELLHVDGLATLAIRRYDRSARSVGIERIHQEDGCQATATPPAQKYEVQGGPSLVAFSNVIRDFGDPADLESLLARVTLNTAIGNADAHAKNFSFLHDPSDPIVRLAPVYDLIATMELKPTTGDGRPIPNDPTMGQRVAGTLDVREVTRQDLVDEGMRWRLRKQIAERVVDETIAKVMEAARNLNGDERVLLSTQRRCAVLAT